MQSRRAFTLMELLITIAMIGILSSMAVARYGKTVERGYWQSARDILFTIYAAEQTYFATHNNQYLSVEGTEADQWRQIYMDNPNVSHIPVIYQGVGVKNAVTPPTFIAVARRRPGVFLTINERRFLDDEFWKQP